METDEFKKYEPEEFRPGAHIQDSEEIVKACSQYAQTIFHPVGTCKICLLYTSPSPRDRTRSRMPSSA